MDRLRIFILLCVFVCCGILNAQAPRVCNAQRIVTQLPYIDDHGQAKFAITKGLHQTPLGTRWSDPDWSVVNQGGPYDFLTYRGADGGTWQTKIHVSGNSKQVDFESKHPGENNGRNGSFLIIDPQSGVWEVTGLKFVQQNGSQTDFDVLFCLAHPQSSPGNRVGGGGGGGSHGSPHQQRQ
jgi:hypothetical protein